MTLFMFISGEKKCDFYDQDIPLLLNYYRIAPH